jgi:type IX secretion system substrate protein
MKTTLLSLFILFTVSLSAQDWFPFPLGQKSYFEQTVHPYGYEFPDTVIQSFETDSFRLENNKLIYYFNYKNPDLSPCYANLETFMSSQGYNPYINTLSLDSIITNQDSIWMHYTNISTPILLIPKTEPGDSWTTPYIGPNYNKLEFTCDTKIFNNVLGVPDSIKIFSIETYNDDTLVSSSMSNQTLNISKTYGFTTFFPYKQSLLGFKSDLISSGFNEPSLQDYFNLQQGDVLIWKYSNDSWDIMTPDTFYYYQDSITSVISTQDSVVYQVIRTQQNGAQTSINQKYYYNNLRGLFVNTCSLITGSAIKGDGYQLFPFDDDFIYSNSPFYYDNEGFKNKHFSFSWIVNNNCQFSEITDITVDLKLNNKYGLYFRNQSNWDNTTWSIEGSTINGIQEGTPWDDLVTSIHNPNNIFVDFKIYPNPTTTQSVIQIKGKDLVNIEILNIQGQLIFETKLVDNKLNIDFPQGIYFLKAINKEGKNVIQKLIVN